jgi:DHHC palmitoyltransferase
MLSPSALLFGGGIFFGILSLILFFGDPTSPTVVGRMTHFLMNTVPALLFKYSGLGRILKCGRKAAYCFFGRPHPVIQLVYVTLVVGCYGLFVVHGYPYLPNQFMGGYHKILGAINFAICVITFVLASFVNPGTITKENNKEYLALYPSDNFMFPAERECLSCGIEKPARSKHCRVTDRCVAKFDHHCIWLNNTVGER